MDGLIINDINYGWMA